MEIVVGTLVVLGFLAILARFVMRDATGEVRLPRIVDDSIGMWVVRRVRTGLSRGPQTRTLTPTVPTARPGPPVPGAPRRESVGAFAGTPERLVAVGARRPVLPARSMPAARSAPPMILSDRLPASTSPMATASPMAAIPRAAWSGRGSAPTPTPVLVPAARRRSRARLQARHLTVAGTALTIGLIGLVGIAAILSPGGPGSGPAGTPRSSGTGSPASARP